MNGLQNRIRQERKNNVEMKTWHKIQFLIRYPTSICSTVLRFLNPHMSYTILFPSSSLVLLRSRPIGQMSAFFHCIPHLDDIKRREWDMLLSHQVKEIYCSRSSTWNRVSCEKKIWKTLLYSVYIYLGTLWEKEVTLAFIISLDAEVSFPNMAFCTFNDIYYLSTRYMASNTKHFALSRNA